MITEIEGDLIKLALEGKFDAIAHGCNCQCAQKSGIAKQIKETFCTDLYAFEDSSYKGDRRKLGAIQHQYQNISPDKKMLVFNFYTQYNFKTEKDPAPFNYGAFWACLQAYRRLFSRHHLGIPMIGAGLAGGDWNRIREIIEEFNDLDITIVKYKKS